VLTAEETNSPTVSPVQIVEVSFTLSNIELSALPEPDSEEEDELYESLADIIATALEVSSNDIEIVSVGPAVRRMRRRLEKGGLDVVFLVVVPVEEDEDVGAALESVTEAVKSMPLPETPMFEEATVDVSSFTANVVVTDAPSPASATGTPTSSPTDFDLVLEGGAGSKLGTQAWLSGCLVVATALSVFM
jgi:hypothetical protein